jgi:hypothetical protein
MSAADKVIRQVSKERGRRERGRERKRETDGGTEGGRSAKFLRISAWNLSHAPLLRRYGGPADIRHAVSICGFGGGGGGGGGGRDTEAAEELYRRALDSDPGEPSTPIHRDGPRLGDTQGGLIVGRIRLPMRDVFWRIFRSVCGLLVSLSSWYPAESDVNGKWYWTAWHDILAVYCPALPDTLHCLAIIVAVAAAPL